MHPIRSFVRNKIEGTADGIDSIVDSGYKSYQTFKVFLLNSKLPTRVYCEYNHCVQCAISKLLYTTKRHRFIQYEFS